MRFALVFMIACIIGCILALRTNDRHARLEGQLSW
jgi:hypothetical protein